MEKQKVRFLPTNNIDIWLKSRWYYHLLIIPVVQFIGAQRRRSPSALAIEVFESHLGSHILQLGSALAPVRSRLSFVDIIMLYSTRYPFVMNVGYPNPHELMRTNTDQIFLKLKT
ncbi:hypothetical protein llap_4732 [Limosa lapponica baueri]|uniref:Uncharacterized protein n=1 Tax=Limosa lapponica baueri TaxID=1758121 RepID=A0A2I0UG08_LIMLA|nr:hypothetical protein llap_4732 [Limosa lapponica baueri]